MTSTNKFFAAVVLVAVASSSALAQTDFGGVGGAGGGVGASVAPLGVPAGDARIGGGPGSGLAAARANFVGATAPVTVPSPAGGTVTVPQAAAAALGAVLLGGATTAQGQTLTAALGGGPTASALTNALAAMGSNPSLANVQAAVNALNAQINALTAAGQTPSATLVAARGAILAAIGT